MSAHALISPELGVSTSNSTHDTFCLIDFYQHIVSINVCTSPDGIYGFQIIYNSIHPSNQIGLLTGTCKTVTYDRDSIYEIHVQTGPAPFPIKALHLKSSQKEVHFGKISILPTIISDYPNFRMFGLAGFMATVDSLGVLSSLKVLTRKQEYSFYNHWKIIKYPL